MFWDTDIDRESAAYKFAADDSKVIRAVAGPGTGKSFGLNRRIARLLEEGQDPKRILAVTFTRTAARDLKKEISSIGIDGSDDVVAKTLHGLCFGFLRNKELIENTGRVPRPMLDFEQKPMLYDIDERFGNIKKKEDRLHAFEAAWARLQSEEPGFPLYTKDRDFQDEVLSWLKIHKAMLFGEIIIETYHYLRNNPMCTELQAFDHVLVDEYQDLNKAEQTVIDYLATGSYLTVIGDDDQSIYSFKCANPEGIREFPDTHAGCNAVNFDYCRRCPKRVVNMASRLISHNKNRTLGALQPFDNNQDGIVKIIQWETLNDEIEGICEIVKHDIGQGLIDPEDVLILTPARKIGYRIRNVLVKNGINAKSYSRESILESDELKHCFSLLSLLANPDDMVSLRFLLGEGSSDYRKKGYARLLEYSIDNKRGIREVLDGCCSGDIRIPHVSALVKKYREVVQSLDRIRGAAIDNTDSFIGSLTEGEYENSDFHNALIESIGEVKADREQDVDQWIREVHSHMLEKASYPDDISEDNHVRIMSLHASKGLSAKYVVVTSVVEGLIPRREDKDAVNDDAVIEEQRRLFYVAITRCKSSNTAFPGKLIISSFVGIPWAEAQGLGMKMSKTFSNKTISSRFIREFEDTAPATIMAQV